jgi:acid stress-induced BolA-like protein IbaG/YrbA
MFTTERIQALIEAGIPGARAIVENPMNDGVHFQARVIAEAFEGLSRVKQHQLVYAALGDHMVSDIHALALRTLTPENWAQQEQL